MKLLLAINVFIVASVLLATLIIFLVLTLLFHTNPLSTGLILALSSIFFTIPALVFIAWKIRRCILYPLKEYRQFIETLSEGNLNGAVEYLESDDVGELGASLNAMVGKFREVDTLKSSFNSVAAHQLRTPLAGIKWALKSLLDGDAGALSPEQHDMVKRVYDANEKMVQMVNNLLYVSRIENGKFGYEFKQNDFALLLHTLRENSDLASRERNVTLVIENRTENLPLFIFDFESMLIALQNIVDNGLKYTPSGGTVTLVAQNHDSILEIRISDTGVGIPAEEQSKLFSKFFRASNAVRLHAEGTGLGLFIAQTIIARHQGTIRVDSLEGKGATFIINLPINEVVQ